jgi:hypothetical protein
MKSSAEIVFTYYLIDEFKKIRFILNQTDEIIMDDLDKPKQFLYTIS